jgi:hypothetical protein
MASEKQRMLEKDTVQVREMVEVLDRRMRLLEERLDFTERLVGPGSRHTEDRGTGAGGP